MSEIGMHGWDGDPSEYFVDRYYTKRNHIYPLSGQPEYYMTLLCEKDFRDAFNNCPPLKAIIGKRAKTFNTGEVQVVNKNTMKPTIGTEAKDLQKLMEKPNVLQSGDQFRSQMNHYIDIYGYCPVLKIKPEGMDIVSQMWNIPPWLFDITYTKQWLRQYKIKDIYKDYFIFWNGERVKLNFEDVFFILDDGIGTDDDTNLTIPDSRLVGLDYPVSNTIAAYKTRNTLITKRGAIGILSNDGTDRGGFVPLKDGEKENVQNDFKRYGLVGQPYQVIITDASLKWQQMGFPTKDLLLFEEIEDNINRLCDAYDWPAELISRSKGVTYANRKEAMKSVYRESIIPQANSRIKQLSRGLTGDESILLIVIDYSNVEILQEDKKIMAEIEYIKDQSNEIKFRNRLLTRNEWREQQGLEKITDDPSFDEYEKIEEPAAPPKTEQ